MKNKIYFIQLAVKLEFYINLSIVHSLGHLVHTH